MLLSEIKDKIISHIKSEEDLSWLNKAYDYALEAHGNQQRVSGESFISHPLGVALILAELELDIVTIMASILHDVVEDTDVTLEDIRTQFGNEVALLVDGVTKLSRLEFHTKEEQQAENLRKMFLAMAKDIRVILIKLADRTHNMRTLEHLSPEKQQEIARETLEIYAPLAHRLGIYKIKSELEDLAFRFLNRRQYYFLAERLAKKKQERDEFISSVKGILQEKLNDAGVKSEIQGRSKNLYSIYAKMREQGKDVHEIYDLMAVRILVDSVKDCYGALGIVHTLWKPIPFRFKDFIAMPKPNMYQSLHTTVVIGKNELLEVQIRTWEMHRTAEYGIAAHWKYKEKVKDHQEFNEKLSWLRQLLEWSQDFGDAHELMEHLKIDLFTDDVFVFTPKGDVIDLPVGSISLDFAYRIHTDIGHRCVGAKVNGRLVPLDYELKTGDIVEVMTSKQGSPSRDWLKMVKTSPAKSKIRSYFKKEKREDNIIKGKEMLERELKRLHIEPHLVLKESLLVEIGKRFNLMTEEDVYAAVGYGGVSSQQVISKIKDELKKLSPVEKMPATAYKADLKPLPKKTSEGVQVDGISNLLIRFAKCCSPVPGDDIIGFVTRGRGVSVHRQDCLNLQSKVKESVEMGKGDRLLDVSWEDSETCSYPVDIEIMGMDRPNLLMDLMNVLAEKKVNITAVNGRTNKDKSVTMHLTVVIKDLSHLDQILNGLNRVKDVFSVRRYLQQ
jgi:GTP diphosphokinase / guanosine-3',5'-bis(diphosphate) 3'-diphosphatase